MSLPWLGKNTRSEGEMAERRLADRVAIVTGAGSGMGRAIALALAEEGARVVLAGRNADNLAETARAVEAIGGPAVVRPTDVTEPAQCQALAQAALDRWGRIDLLVNNAGTNTRRRGYADAT